MPDMESEESMVVLYRASDATEAALILQALAADGIDAIKSGGVASVAFGELGADALLVDVLVRRSSAERARTVVEKLQELPRTDGAPTDWRCACDEENDGSFEVCWSCQTPRPAA